jgi:hypothetical protein
MVIVEFEVLYSEAGSRPGPGAARHWYIAGDSKETVLAYTFGGTRFATCQLGQWREVTLLEARRLGVHLLTAAEALLEGRTTPQVFVLMSPEVAQRLRS